MIRCQSACWLQRCSAAPVLWEANIYLQACAVGFGCCGFFFHKKEEVKNLYLR